MSECCNQTGKTKPNMAYADRGVSRDDDDRRKNEGLARAYGIDSPGSLGGALRAPDKQGPDTLGITFDPNDFV